MRRREIRVHGLHFAALPARIAPVPPEGSAMQRLGLALVLTALTAPPGMAQITTSTAAGTTGATPPTTATTSNAAGTPTSTLNTSPSTNGTVNSYVSTTGISTSNISSLTAPGTSGATASPSVNATTTPATTSGTTSTSASTAVPIVCPADEPLIGTEIAGTGLSCAP
jgi:hypothetical protein